MPASGVASAVVAEQVRFLVVLPFFAPLFYYVMCYLGNSVFINISNPTVYDPIKEGFHLNNFIFILQ
jgi:hypothetical protein